VIDFSRNHFDLFGLPERFGVDVAALDRAYRSLQAEVHPDRHAGADEAAQRAALQASARVNEAYRALRDPVARAQYLLSLRGVDAFAAHDTSLAVAFLERQLERREAAESALVAKDEPRLAALQAEVRADAKAQERRVGESLDAASDLAAARAQVREFRFLAKLAEDIADMHADLVD
jgi:molecular chaperone HscB